MFQLCIMLMGVYAVLGLPAEPSYLQEADTEVVGSTIREVRELPQEKDLLPASTNKNEDPDNFEHIYDSGDADVVGYIKHSADKGSDGYKHFDSFHKKDGDKYGYEHHTAFGKGEKDSESTNQNAKYQKNSDDASGNKKKSENDEEATHNSYQVSEDVEDEPHYDGNSGAHYTEDSGSDEGGFYGHHKDGSDESGHYASHENFDSDDGNAQVSEGYTAADDGEQSSPYISSEGSESDDLVEYDDSE